MKKLFSLVFFVLFLFIPVFSGCSPQAPPDPVTDFSASAVIQYGDMEIQGELTNTRQGNMTFTVTAPETLQGMKYSYKNGDLTISMNDLNCTAPLAYFPQQGIAQTLFACLQTMNSYDTMAFQKYAAESAVFSGTSAEVSCTFTADISSGLLQTLETDSFTVVFSDVQPFDVSS